MIFATISVVLTTILFTGKTVLSEDIYLDYDYADNKQAQAGCPGECEKEGFFFTGRWTNTAQGHFGKSVCGCDWYEFEKIKTSSGQYALQIVEPTPVCTAKRCRRFVPVLGLVFVLAVESILFNYAIAKGISKPAKDEKSFCENFIAEWPHDNIDRVVNFPHTIMTPSGSRGTVWRIDVESQVRGGVPIGDANDSGSDRNMRLDYQNIQLQHGHTTLASVNVPTDFYVGQRRIRRALVDSLRLQETVVILPMPGQIFGRGRTVSDPHHAGSADYRRTRDARWFIAAQKPNNHDELIILNEQEEMLYFRGNASLQIDWIATADIGFNDPTVMNDNTTIF